MKKLYLFFLFTIFIFCEKSFAQVPVMNSIIGSGSVCSSPAVPTGFSTSASNSPTSYNWIVSPGAGVTISTPNMANTTIAFPHSNGVYTVYCTATNGSGTSAATQYTVAVFETPTVTFSGANSFCQGSSTNLQASSTILAASPTISYNWSPGTGLNTTSGPFVNASPAVTTTYSVTGTIGFCSNTSTILVTVNPLPSVSATASAYTICNGSSASITIFGNATSYSVNTISTPLLFVVSPFANSNYNITGLLGACSNSTNVFISVNPLPIINATSNTTLLCVGQSATLSISGTGTTYSLNTISTPTTVVISPTITTTYTISTKNSFGCYSSQNYTQNVGSCQGIKDNGSVVKNKLLLYPNPSNGQFIIKSDLYEKATITNELGQTVSVIYLQPGIETKITSLKTGIYFITTETTKTKVVIIE